MDRGLNLEALAEEDDDGIWDKSSASVMQISEDPGDNFSGGEPNQFDNLCDGVLACMALVHASLGEMLDLKDELLRHSLPPSVLTRSVLVTSKVFRSFSDMHVPIRELIRMVRLYSTPWEEKSTALKKLHDDYEGKKTQLNIAIKKLELIDGHSRRITQERRVMNWEKLFSKLNAAKGHGRRWKFLIGAFKKRAGLGMEQLQDYLDSMDASSEEDEPEEDVSQMAQISTDSPSLNNEEEEEQENASSDSESSSEDEDAEKKPTVHWNFGVAPELQPQYEEVPQVVIVKPEVKDASMMADEVDFDNELHIRVFKPEGLDYRELKCILNLGDMMWKTDVLDIQQEEQVVSEEVKAAQIKEDIKPTTTPKRGGRGRGMISGRGSRSSPSKTPTLQMAPLSENEENVANLPQQAEHKHFEETFFALPEETPQGQYLPIGQTRVVHPQHLRVAVHYGPMEEMVAMATIHMSDLLKLDIPTVVLEPPFGDVFDAEKAEEEERERSAKQARASTTENAIFAVERANTDLEEIVTSDEDEETTEKLLPMTNLLKPKLYDVETEKYVNEQLSHQEVSYFPLYSIHSGKSDSVHTPCGMLPLICFWIKKEVPKVLCKMTEAESLIDIVMDMTGINLNVMTKEDLHKEMRDEALSTMSITPEVREETVCRSEYDRLMSTHSEEMEMLQNDYEQRLQELMDTIQDLQQMSVMGAIAQQPPRPRSQSPGHSIKRKSPVYKPQLVNKITETDPSLYEQLPKPQPTRVGKPLPKWGKNLSSDFFERLQKFEELSQQKRAELHDQIISEMRSEIERKMASQHRLAPNKGEEILDAVKDVSLPAVFLPSKSTNLQIFNPRAHKYFHPTGKGGPRLSQPPSILMLPPLPKSKLSVLNLFDVSKNFHQAGPDWLMQQYLASTIQEEQANPDEQQQQQTMPQNVQIANSQVADVPVKPKSAGQANHSYPPPIAKPNTISRRSHLSSAKSRRSMISGRISQQLTTGESPIRYQVTLPGNTPLTEDPTQEPATYKFSPSGYSPQQLKAAGTPLGMDGRMSLQSVNASECMPLRSAMTVSVTPGILKSPNPVGQQEAGLLAPMPRLSLIESGTPI